MKSAPAVRMNVAQAKRHFSDLLGRVAYGHETVLIMRRGRPMARLVPAEPDEGSLPAAVGFLEDDDPFFGIMEEIVAARAQHAPRVAAARRRRVDWSDCGRARLDARDAQRAPSLANSRCRGGVVG